jgi:hypothetical protein
VEALQWAELSFKESAKRVTEGLKSWKLSSRPRSLLAVSAQKKKKTKKLLPLTNIHWIYSL